MKELTKRKQEFIVPRNLTFEEAKELFKEFEPAPNKIGCVLTLPFSNSPSSGIMMSKDMLNEQRMLIAEKGALLLYCEDKALEGRKIILGKESVISFQKTKTFNIDVELENGEMVSDYPTDYLYFQVYKHEIECFINN